MTVRSLYHGSFTQTYLFSVYSLFDKPMETLKSKSLDELKVLVERGETSDYEKHTTRNIMVLNKVKLQLKERISSNNKFDDFPDEVRYVVSMHFMRIFRIQYLKF
jgi:hypothetical protein